MNMCGRFGIIVDFRFASKLYGAKVNYEFTPNYNVSPGMTVPVIVKEDKPTIEGFRWGFTPHWAKDPSIGMKMINARAETVPEKPSFKSSFQSRRCLILASGFYEWKKGPKAKTPYYIMVRNRKLFSFAGLWTVWTSPEGDEMRSCTIITTQPNAFVRDIHDRMPVVLREEREDAWIDPDTSEADLKAMLAPYPDKDTYGHPVSREVNYTRNNSPELIKPLTSGQGSLESFLR